MSQQSSPRKSVDVSSLQGAEPKRKNRGSRRRRPAKPEENPPKFLTQDEFSDVTVMVGEQRLYSNRCLLSYHSEVFCKQLESDGGKGKSKSNITKELDLSDKSFYDIQEMMRFIDPREEYTLKDDDAVRLIRLADEYEMRRLKQACGQTMTQSYFSMIKGRRAGSIPTDVTLQYLVLADKHKFEDLTNMCVDECVAKDSLYDTRAITDCEDLSEGMKVKILDKRLERVKMQLARERRMRTDKEEMENKGGRMWKR